MAVDCGSAVLRAVTSVPPRPTGWVVYPRLAGTERLDADRAAAMAALARRGLATLSLDLADADEVARRGRGPEAEALAERLTGATQWLRAQPAVQSPIGYLADRPTADAALVSAAQLGETLDAVVAGDPRLMISDAVLQAIAAPVLLLPAAGNEPAAQRALKRLASAPEALVLPVATRGADSPLARVGGEWLERWLAGTGVPEAQRRYRLSRRDRRDLARRMRRLLEDQARGQLAGRSPRRVRDSIAVVAGALAVLVASSADPTDAEAAVTSAFALGQLTVTIAPGSNPNPDTSVVVTCSGSGADARVKVNGSDPTTGDETCQSIARILVTGDGSDNTINLSGVTPSGFTATMPTPTATVNAGDGADTVVGSAFADDINGDGVAGGTDGADSLVGGAGADTFRVSDGADTICGGTGAACSGADTDQVVASGDVNFTLTNAALTAGVATSALSSIEQAGLTGGLGANSLNAAAFTGTATLDGAGANDTLTGGTGNDALTGGEGTADRLVQTADGTLTLSDLALTGALGTDTLAGVEQASLAGGANGDTLDAGAFTLGPVTLDGAGGSDSLTGGGAVDGSVPGSAAGDALTGGPGNDEIDGGPNAATATADRVVESGDVDFALTDGSLTGQGTDVLNGIDRAHLTGGASGNTLDSSDFTGPATLDGAAGSDTISGGTGSDLLTGGTGDTDQLRQLDSPSLTLSDTALTGLGTDTLSGIDEASLVGGTGGDTLNAGTFTKPTTIDGAAGDDSITGGTAVDELKGDLGNDTLASGLGASTLTGGVGNDELTGNTSADSLVAGDGVDVLTASDGNDTLEGGADADNLTAGTGNDTLQGGTGGDTLTADDGNDSLEGGDDGDTLTAGVGNDTLLGGLGADSLDGGDGDDSADGEDANDTLTGAAGADTITGSAGVDRIVETANANLVLTNASLSGAGGDSLSGLERASLTGGNAANVLDSSGFPGDTTLDGGAGNDTLSGGIGDDSLVGNTDTDRLVQTADGNLTLSDTALSGALGTDTLAGIEQASLTGGAGANVLDASTFAAGSVTLDGLAQNDSLTGGDGSDSLLGRAGDDTVSGGVGDDTITGADGNDSLTAGDNTATGDRLVEAGDVNFALNDSALTGLGSDTHSGFERAEITGGDSPNTLDATGFTGTSVLTGGADSDTLTGGSGADTLDGTSGTADRLVATVSGNQALTNTALAGDVLAAIDEASVTGSSGQDTLNATAFTGPVTLAGAADNDDLRAGNAGGTLLGGLGDDTLAGGTGVDDLSGNDGNDRLSAATGNDRLHGGDNTDLVVESPADVNFTLTDTSLTGLGNDTVEFVEQASLTGGASANALDASGFSGTATLTGGAGADTVAGGTGADSLLGDAGNDDLSGGGGNVADALNGGADTDRVTASADADIEIDNAAVRSVALGEDSIADIERASLTGGAGANVIDASSFSGQTTLVGAGANDTLVGTSEPDSIQGGDGDDSVTGAGSNDTVSGAAGDDSLNAGGGTGDRLAETANVDFALEDDSLTGLGTDSLAGIEQAHLTGGTSGNVLDASLFTGATTLSGGTGSDTLSGGTGSDSLVGGGGASDTDRLFQDADVNFTLTDTSLTGLGTDTLSGINEAKLVGGAAANTIDASDFTAPSTLDGGGGGDVISGGTAGDTLTGSTGDDTVDGGPATDRLVESGDNDFVISDSLAGGQGIDSLTAVEQAHLTGGDSGNLLDANQFSGQVTLTGGDGSDVLSGSQGSDQIDGGAGDADRLEQDVDASLTLTDVSLTGMGTDTLTGIDEASLEGGASANTLNASAFTAGPVTLNGAAEDDTLSGGSGNDSLAGGIGDDRLVQAENVDFDLSNAALTGFGTDVLSGIDEASLTGGSGANTLDSSDFTAGPVTLDGAGANDTLSAGPADDSLVGDSGTDRVVQSADANSVLTDTSLTGLGSDTLSGVERASLSGGAGANVLDASAFTGNVTLDGAGASDTLSGASGNDLIVGGSGGTDRLAQSADVDFTLTDTSATGLGSDTLSGVDEASLTGGAGANALDASAFTHAVTLDGAAGNDVLEGATAASTLTGGADADSLLGQAAADSLSAGDGDDTLTGAGGADTLTGGDDTDRVAETADANLTLTDTSLAGAGGDGLSGIEQASLTGGASANTLDASAFTGASTLDGAGANDTLTGGGAADSLDGDDGDDILTGAAAGDSLTGGAGTDRVVETADADFTLSDSSVAGAGGDALLGVEQASLTGGASANTLDASAFSGTTTLDGAGGDDTLSGGGAADSVIGGDGTDRLVQSADANLTLTDTSLAGAGGDGLSGIEQASLTGGASANTIDASAFTGPSTLDGAAGNDTLAGGGAADSLAGGGDTDRVLASGDADFTLTDASVGGDALSGVEQASLTGGASANTLDASAFTGTTTLDGAGGDDTLTGGAAADSVSGGDGTDRLVQSADANLTLTDSSLAGAGGDGLSGIEQASLTGGAGANTLDSSAFTGPSTLDGAGGDDTLTGGAAADSLAGGDGTDRVVAAGDTDFTLTDTSLTGAGGDSLSAVEQAGLTGGAGANTLDASAFTGTTTLDGGTGDDTLSGGTAADSLAGSEGADSVTGAAGDDMLAGATGDDTLEGGAGTDSFTAGDGDDTLRSRDTIAESVACDAGEDDATVDPADTTTGCEVVDTGVTPPPPDNDGDGIPNDQDCAPNDATKPAQGGTDANCDGTVDPTDPQPPAQPPPDERPPPAGQPGPGDQPAADTQAPVVRFFLPATTTLRGNGVLSVLVACPAGEQTCAGTVTLQTAARVQTAARRRVRLGSARFRIAGGQSRTVRVRLSRRNRALVARLRRVRVRATVAMQDAAGNRATKSRVFTVRAAPRGSRRR